MAMLFTSSLFVFEIFVSAQVPVSAIMIIKWCFGMYFNDNVQSDPLNLVGLRRQSDRQHLRNITSSVTSWNIEL